MKYKRFIYKADFNHVKWKLIGSRSHTFEKPVSLVFTFELRKRDKEVNVIDASNEIIDELCQNDVVLYENIERVKIDTNYGKSLVEGVSVEIREI